jgi:predicted membrane protein
MRTELPTAAEYYRPGRVQELRRQAARLERSARWLSALFHLCRVAFWLMVLLVNLTAVMSYAVAVHLFLTGVGAMTAGKARKRYRQEATDARAEADALEAEHEARYGALPGGEEG